ncbi:insulinase family protein [uncultured Alistipes sp.]|mgnify:FL=1|uniref:M16 family metallopeptidase n=1 Tax=uncultured Alistipes sp. TaxID=538949 RepID=UPI00261FC2ED|nr:insulinase family protein [uncultured Alistipes sp.]
MKRLLTLTVVVLSLLASSCSKYKYETVKGDPMQTRIYTLPNGLKVYMSVNKETPRIQTYIAVRVGGKNDPAETTGLAHYFEHLMFKGTPSFGTSDYAAEKPMLDEIEQLFETYRQTEDEAERAAIYHRIDSISYEASKISIPNEYDKLMAAIGANGTNAYTSQDMTVYVEDIPSNEVENWAKIEADRFRNPVIRGFHTELETIYEEKNMSLTRDARKVWEALDAALFPHHPYGTQTVLGTQEHLKNPSITNVRNYHKTYYVPNNMAICLSGDLNPDEVIATIDKYFGDMMPNENLPKLEFQPEEPITEPVVREVYGLEAANVMIGWRLPGNSTDPNDVAQIASAILNNGQAGLIDLDLNQQQKVLGAYGGYSGQPDYSTFLVGGSPKAGQSLEEVRDLLLAEVAKLRAGDFDEKLIEASINNFKLYQMKAYEDNASRADMYVQSFISGTDWADEVAQLDRMAKITKQDIVDWANEYLGEKSYAIVYKREGEDRNVQKIAAPKITPIVTNRDKQSAFLTEIQQSKVTPIEPVFVDYQKDMTQFDVREGIHVLYKKNELNDIFTLNYIFDTGTENDPSLSLAFDYMSYLGTEAMSAEQIASEMYDIACSFSMYAGSNQCSISISGLSENMPRAMEIVEGLISGAVADEEILENLKQDMIKERADAKLNQARNFGALQRYLYYGEDYIKRTTLTNDALAALGSEQLITAVQALMGKQHEVLYYGPKSEEEVKQLIAENHKAADELAPLEKNYPKKQLTDQSSVILAQYDANQLYYLQFSNRGEAFDVKNDPAITLYNEYFGGSMNSICFQEMREARGLAYTAQAWLASPSFAGDSYSYTAFIATQNDKMQTAIEAFDEIINQMPESEAAFQIAKDAIISRLRTDRTTGADVLNSYIQLRRLGLSEDRDRQIFEKVQTMTLEDVKATQQQWVKDRPYTYGILGDIKNLDLNFLKTLGPIRTVSQEEIFGY